MSKLKIVAITLAILGLGVCAFTGCATDKAYNVAKTIYIGGKAVVIQNADMLDKKTLDTLKKADDYAKRYDKARAIIKKSIEKSADTNLSKARNGS